MDEARALISVFRELNESTDRRVSLFTSSLVSLFGSTSMFNAFLAEIDAGLNSHQFSTEVKTRAANLTNTYIPQVAGLNDIQDFDQQTVTAEELRNIRNDSAESRKQGARTILAALSRILKQVSEVS
jgi:membrane-bound lytic murein transglycosylase B